MKKQHILFLDFLFISILIFLLGFSYFSYWRIEKLKAASDLVNHSTILKLKLNGALINVTEAETGQRGYLLTRDSTYLSEFNHAFEKANSEATTVVTMTADNPSQNDRAKRLKRLIDDRLDRLNSIVRYSHDPAYSAEGLGKMLESGKKIMDDTRELAGEMVREEDALLRGRSKEKQSAGAITPLIVLLFSVFATLMIIVAYIRLRSETHLRMRSQDSEATIRKLQQESIEMNLLLERKVQQRTHELQKKNILLENINDELLSFNYVASHDLQEPLRKIQAFSNRILETENNFSEKTKDYFLRITSAASRMQKLLEALISYSRADNSDMDFLPTDLDVVLEEVKGDIREAIEEKKVIIINHGLPTLNIIPLQFHQLFLNLLMNSIKYSRTDLPPKIIITSEITDVKHIKKPVPLYGSSYWKITFSDNGIGFSREYEEKIFELFQRLHGKNEFEGTGIGLAICRKIIQNHNGHIYAEGRPEEGATFTIFLPINN